MNALNIPIIIIILGLAGWGLRIFIKSTIEKAVEAGFARELEDYKAQLKRHEQAVIIASILARRVSGGNKHREEVNQEIWEAQLWLPAKIAQNLSRVLVEDASPSAVKGLLVEVRKLIHGGDDSMTAEQFTHADGT